MKRWPARVWRAIREYHARLLAARRGRKRVLIREILSLQLMITGVIGALAIAALYWGGQWVLQGNYSRWAMQWTEDLNELGAPLYLRDDNDVILRLERFVSKYSEISSVTYYERDGTQLFTLRNETRDEDDIAELDSELLLQVSELVGSDAPYIIQSSLANARTFSVLAPVWTESIPGDGLFGFDPTDDTSASATELVGFVGLKLDFILFHDQLVHNIKIATSVLLVLLIISGFIGRKSLQKALSAISDLQEPIAELAKGNLSVQFKPAEHREISEIVEALESTASALVERDAKLLQLANHDSLTGLFNRWRLVEELKTEIDNVTVNAGTSSLLFIDLDQFKYVNDTCGHPAGDRLLKKVADQLRRSVGDNCVVSRFGGDEFTVLTTGTSKQKTRELAESILEDMRRLAHIESDNIFHVNCSIGIAMITSDQFDHDDLIAQADIACREAKANGRNRLGLFNMSAREAEKMVEDVSWASKLRDAIDNDSFILRYQPIVCITTGVITHHEVLLRMPGDDGKLIGPDAFLPAAVRFGLMAEIDTWMVDHSIEALAKHREEANGLRISVNLSVNAFETENLAAFVKVSLEKHNVPAQAVIFEITESVAVRHLKHVESQISLLRTMGCELALDDFGTGYSSFSYLQNLAVDYIKIDGCFIRNLANNPVDQKMVRMIGEIGREAGMKTIAEYVQDGEVLSLLDELGIDLAQGYYIGRPIAAPTRKSMPIPLDTRRRRNRGTALS